MKIYFVTLYLFCFIAASFANDAYQVSINHKKNIILKEITELEELRRISSRIDGDLIQLKIDQRKIDLKNISVLKIETGGEPH